MTGFLKTGGWDLIDEGFSFGELQVSSIIDNYFKKDEILKSLYVFDDGVIRGFMQINGTEICKLYVEPFFQSSFLLSKTWISSDR